MTSERKFVTEAVKRVLLKEYLQKKTQRAGFGGLDIQRTPMGTRVTLITERPGMVIGRKGRTIDELTMAIARDFKFDNPQIEVQEVRNPNLNARIMAQKLAEALERGWHFRRAGHSTVRRIMDAGAKGCLIIISGKLTGERHRTEKFIQGHIKHCGEPAEEFMLKGFAAAKKKPGIIGVRVQIMVPDAKLPDEINIHPIEMEEETEKSVQKEKEEPVKEEPDKDEDKVELEEEKVDVEEKKEEEEPKKKSLKKKELEEVQKIVEEEKAKLEEETEEKVKLEEEIEDKDKLVEETENQDLPEIEDSSNEEGSEE